MPVVLVPWRGGCPHRERAWAYLAARYEDEGWRVIRCECPAGPWVKALAVNPVVAECSEGPVVVADADVWCDGLGEAVQAVREGAAWARPHAGVFRLSEQASKRVLAGAPLDEDCELDQRAYKGIAGGGVVVAQRDVLLSIPLDPRFVGWGQEDESWGLALHCLAGAPWRGRAPLFHLWHPPQERLTRRYGSVEGRKLHRRYLAARADPERMRALIEEVSGDAHAADQPPLHDRQAGHL